MRLVFNFIKDTLKKIDGYWIESAGHPILVQGVFKPDPKVKDKDRIYLENRGKIFEQTYPPVIIYGFYDMDATQSHSIFGLNSPDEIEIEVNDEIVCRKLNQRPLVGTLLRLEDSDWIVNNRNLIFNRFIGKYRLNLSCSRFQISVTSDKNSIHNGHTVNVEDNDDEK